MEEVLELAHAKDTNEHMAGVECLHHLLEASRKSLTSSEVTSLLDCCLDLLKDNNFRVSQGTLQALTSAAGLSGNHLKLCRPLPPPLDSPATTSRSISMRLFPLLLSVWAMANNPSSESDCSFQFLEFQIFPQYLFIGANFIVKKKGKAGVSSHRFLLQITKPETEGDRVEI
ncbi:hypothetical protein ACFX15_031505 [Malus domestica]